MQVRVEDVNSVKKILHIEIPQESIDEELDKAYKDLKKTARVKGFRPGKAPRSVLERHYQKSVNADVLSKLIQSTFVEALKETDLQVIGEPRINPPELQTDAPCKYEATVEVNPEIADIDFKGLTIKKPVYRYSEEEVEKQLKALQKNFAYQKKLEEDRPVREEDFVLIDYEGFKDGESFEETQLTQNFTLKVGDGHILKEFDDQLIGMRPGESKEFSVHFPDDYFNAKLAGLDIDFKVTLKEIREEVLPEIDDELAKKMGPYETLDELRAEIRKNLEQGYNKRADQEVNEQVFQALIERTDFEVPETLIEHELASIINEAERAFAAREISMEEMGFSREKLAERYRDTAEKQVRRYLILNKIIEQENLEVSDEELENGFKEMADTYQRPVEEIKKHFHETPDKLGFFKHALLEKNAIKLIVDSGVVEEVEPAVASQEAEPDDEKQSSE